MQSPIRKFRDNAMAVVFIGILSGVLLCYVYDFVRFISKPIALKLLIAVFNPQIAFAGVAAINLVLVVAAGMIASIVVLFAQHYFLRPARMYGFVLCAIVFFALEEWDILTQWPTKIEIEYVALKLISPIIVVAVFLFGASWLARTNRANHPMQPTVETGG